MKNTTAALFLMFIFSVTQSSCLFGVANAAGDAVWDVGQNDVLTGVRYYVMSAIFSAEGGELDIDRESCRMCPEIIVQKLQDFGTPVVFSNADSSDHFVRVSSDVRVTFDGQDKLCRTSRVWKVQDKDNSTGKTWLELGGSEGEPGCDTVQNWFKIETDSFGGSYQFKYCPSVCDSSATSCNSISPCMN